MPTFRIIWRGFVAFGNFWEYLCTTFGVALLSAMWVLLLINCLAKWTDAFTARWTIEVLRYMVAWSIFIMAGPVTRWDAHIKVNFLPNKLLGEKRGTAFMYASENFVGLGLCSYLTLHAYRFIKMTIDQGWVEESVYGWEYPMWAAYSGILIGFFLCSIYYFERTVKWIGSFFISEGVSEGEAC